MSPPINPSREGGPIRTLREVRPVCGIPTSRESLFGPDSSEDLDPSGESDE